MGITRGGWRVTAGLIAAGVAAAVTLAGCGAADGGDNASTGVAAPGVAPAEDGKAGEAPAEQRDETSAGGGAAPAGAPARFEVDERSIIYTGSITVRVSDPAKVDTAAVRAIALVTGAGGFVGSDKRDSDNGHSQAALELRVPADKFTSVVDQLAELGKEEARAISTEDVTEAVVDLDARIATQQASVNRTRVLLSQARSIAEIVSVEGELAKREAELASLQAKKRRLADLTALSTITLMLIGPDAPDARDDEPDTGFLAGLQAGWKAFLASLEILLTVIGALIPWVIALGVPIFGLVWLLRWLARRSRPAPPPPA